MSGEGKGTGGKRGMPRSLGLVFRAIREQLGIEQPEMATILYEIEEKNSPFNQRLGKHPTEIKDLKGKVHKWESGLSDLNFTLQHRYAVVSKTRTGVLHTISGFYCHFRRALKAELNIEDAPNPKNKTTKKEFNAEREKQLNAIIDMAKQHKAVCDLAIVEAETAKEDKEYLKDTLGNLPYVYNHKSKKVNQKSDKIKGPHLNFIGKFLDAYRNGYSDDGDCT